MKDKTQLNMVSFNCRSIRNKVVPVLSYLQDYKIDICMLQETWLNKGDSAIIQEIKDHGYNIHSQRRLKGETGGGVAILSKPNIQVRRCESRVKYNCFEYISCTVHTMDKTFRIINIYKLPYSKKHPVTNKMFFDEFSNLMETQITLPGELIITGDFNCHIEKLDNKKDRNDLLLLVDSFNLHQYVTGVTHVLGGTLDLIMTATEGLAKEVEIIDDRLGSDHHPITFKVYCSIIPDNGYIVFSRRKYKELDIENFKTHLSEAFVSHPFEDLDARDAVTLYNKIVKDTLDIHCPVTTTRTKKRPSSPWFTKELQEIKRLKRRCERVYRKLGTKLSKNAYKSAKKRYNSSMTATREEYYKNKLDETKKDMKSMYKTLNRVLGQEKQLIYPTNKNAKSVANEMSDFFLDKITNIRESISQAYTPSFEKEMSHEKPDVKPLKKFSELTSDDVKCLLKGMNNKSCDLDPMPTWLLKECIGVLLPVLTHIINSSLKSNSFPDLLKCATITPIIKDPDGDCELYRNYRPISNTSFIAKLLEKSALNQINQHIDSNNLHSEFQSGYRKYHSCETATLKVVDDIKRDIEKGNLSALLLLDMSAAFDTVDHSTLLNRLSKSYGIKDGAAEWIQSYLTGRTFSVRVNGQDSKIKNVLFGVPQGSLLGPLMFILYTKDLTYIAAKYGLSIHLYADDTQLYIGFQPVDNINVTEELIEKCLNDIKQWMLKNFLKLNPEKTDMILIGSKKKLQAFDSLSIYLDNKEIKSSNVVKTLGVLLDPTLSMTQEINQKCSSAYFHLRNIGRIKRCLDEKRRILLVQSLVLSKLDYCNSILANVPMYLIKKLQRVMNAAVRMIYDVKKRDHISPYIMRAHFLPVKYRIRFKLCLIVYKALHGMAPDYIQELLVPRHPTLRGGRDIMMLEIPFKKEKTVQYQMCIHWNELPLNIRMSSSIAQFKKNLKTHYFQEAFGNNNDTDSDDECIDN